jgi:LacI family transcriptional regulator
MVRLKDIAQRAGVSLMTVSKALRDGPDVSASTKTRIKLLAQQMGYVPDSTAQGLRNRTTRLFGLAVASAADPFLSRLVLAVEQRAYELGYDLLLAHTLDIPEREDACIRRFLARRVDGLFLSPVYRLAAEARVYQDLLARRVPTVLLAHPAPFCAQFTCVETDDLLGGYTATRHLLKLGHRRIAFLAGPPATPWAQQRFEGYRRALRETGLDVDEKLVFQAGRTTEDGAKAAAQLLAENSNATAVQAANDLVAVGCAETFLKRGLRIPDHVSLIGFGNIALCDHLQVPLTTMNQPKYRLGAAAVAAMQQLLRGQHPDLKPLPAELVQRASTGAPPASPSLHKAKPPTA